MTQIFKKKIHKFFNITPLKSDITTNTKLIYQNHSFLTTQLL